MRCSTRVLFPSLGLSASIASQRASVNVNTPPPPTNIAVAVGPTQLRHALYRNSSPCDTLAALSPALSRTCWACWQPAAVRRRRKSLSLSRLTAIYSYRLRPSIVDYHGLGWLDASAGGRLVGILLANGCSVSVFCNASWRRRYGLHGGLLQAMSREVCCRCNLLHEAAATMVATPTLESIFSSIAVGSRIPKFVRLTYCCLSRLIETTIVRLDTGHHRALCMRETSDTALQDSGKGVGCNHDICQYRGSFTGLSSHLCEPESRSCPGVLQLWAVYRIGILNLGVMGLKGNRLGMALSSLSV